MTGLAGRRRWTKNKFGNVKTEVDGVRFDSKGEAAYWQQLRLRERAGEISDLKRQVSFPMPVGDLVVCRLVVDFVYCEAGEWVAEDFKGVVTPECRIKLKLFRAIYGYDVRLVGRK